MDFALHNAGAARRANGRSYGLTYSGRAVLGHRNSSDKVLRRPVESGQFTSQDWQDFVAEHGLVASMSRRGNCHDNAVAARAGGMVRRDAQQQRMRRKPGPGKSRLACCRVKPARCLALRNRSGAEPSGCRIARVREPSWLGCLVKLTILLDDWLHWQPCNCRKAFRIPLTT